jgi:hypothetical protein
MRSPKFIALHIPATISINHPYNGTFLLRDEITKIHMFYLFYIHNSEFTASLNGYIYKYNKFESRNVRS